MARSRRRRGRIRRPNRGVRGRRRQNRGRRQGNRVQQGAQGRVSRGWGNFVASGVRTILGLLPGGKTMQHLFDFAWKPTVMTSDIVHSAGQYSGTGLIVGLSSSTSFTVASLVANSQYGSIVDASGVRSVRIPFHDGKIASISISASPTNVASKRSGEWVIGFCPFRTENDVGMFSSRVPDFDDVLRWPGSVSGPADKILNLRYVPRVYDGRIFGFLKLSETVGCSVVAYRDPNRTTYDNFTSGDFSATIKASARVFLRAQYPTSNATEYKDEITDELKNVKALIRHTNGRLTLHKSAEITSKPEEACIAFKGSAI